MGLKLGGLIFSGSTGKIGSGFCIQVLTKIPIFDGKFRRFFYSSGRILFYKKLLRNILDLPSLGQGKITILAQNSIWASRNSVIRLRHEEL